MVQVQCWLRLWLRRRPLNSAPQGRATGGDPAPVRHPEALQSGEGACQLQPEVRQALGGSWAGGWGGGPCDNAQAKYLHEVAIFLTLLKSKLLPNAFVSEIGDEYPAFSCPTQQGDLVRHFESTTRSSLYRYAVLLD